MPPGREGQLGAETYRQIAALILSSGDIDPAVLAAAGFGPAAAPQTGTTRYRDSGATGLTAVTEDLLRRPPAEDWLSWRRTRDNLGYSPLDQITRENAGELELAWVLSMREGQNQTTPLVHDGVMFLANPGNVVQAIDAATGDLIWEYRYGYPPDALKGTGATRGLALYGDKVFLAAYDASIIAIDTRTGEQVWQTRKADHTQGFTHTSAPVIANGVVVSGINGCEQFTDAGCFITGHDPDTGAELWRTSTVAQPGDPNNSSWGDIPPHLRGGADMWIPGAYDSGLDLFYIGTAQAKPWVAASRGMSTTHDALYTNSTLALDPLTGEVAWFFQHVPGETLDLDSVYERMLIDVDGEPLLLTAGKDGLLWKLRRDDGRFLGVKEMVHQDIFESIDRQTGRVTYRRDIRNATVGEPVPACPGYFGGRNWMASAYSPETGAVVFPLVQACMTMTGRPVELVEGSGNEGGIAQLLPMPGVRREHRQARGLRRADVRRALELPAAGHVPDVGIDDGRRCRLRGRPRPLLPCVRRRDGRYPLGKPPRPRGARLPDHLRGERQTVRRRPDGPRRLQNRLGLAQPRDLRPPERQRDIRLRAAGLTRATRIWRRRRRTPDRSRRP